VVGDSRTARTLHKPLLHVNGPSCRVVIQTGLDSLIWPCTVIRTRTRKMIPLRSTLQCYHSGVLAAAAYTYTCACDICRVLKEVRTSSSLYFVILLHTKASEQGLLDADSPVRCLVFDASRLPWPLLFFFLSGQGSLVIGCRCGMLVSPGALFPVLQMHPMPTLHCCAAI
jgi:hypothetical protein